MDLSSINAQIVGAVAQARKVEAASSSGGFGAALESALKSVSQSQQQADGLQRQFQLGNPEVSLEQTMVAMNTSQLGFAAAVQVRNRLVQAYDQVMNMSV
jgi:flagellar hook-basal body complex protein FliE